MSGDAVLNALHFGKYCMDTPCVCTGCVFPSGSTLTPLSLDPNDPPVFDDEEDWFSDSRVYACNCIRAKNYRARGPSVRVLDAGLVRELHLLANELEQYETSSGMGVSEIMQDEGGFRSFIRHVENILRMKETESNKNKGVEYMQAYLNEKQDVLRYREHNLQLKKDNFKQGAEEAWRKMQILIPDTAAGSNIRPEAIAAAKDKKMLWYSTMCNLRHARIVTEENQLKEAKNLIENELLELAAARSNPCFVELFVFESL
jgi:hypothetical protein